MIVSPSHGQLPQETEQRPTSDESTIFDRGPSHDLDKNISLLKKYPDAFTDSELSFLEKVIRTIVDFSRSPAVAEASRQNTSLVGLFTMVLATLNRIVLGVLYVLDEYPHSQVFRATLNCLENLYSASILRHQYAPMEIKSACLYLASVTSSSVSNSVYGVDFELVQRLRGPKRA